MIINYKDKVEFGQAPDCLGLFYQAPEPRVRFNRKNLNDGEVFNIFSNE